MFMEKYLSKTITILKAPMVLTIFNEIYIRFHKPQIRIFDLKHGKTAKTQATSAVREKRPSVNYATEWLDQLFPFHGLM